MRHKIHLMQNTWVNLTLPIKYSVRVNSKEWCMILQTYNSVIDMLPLRHVVDAKWAQASSGRLMTIMSKNMIIEKISIYETVAW